MKAALNLLPLGVQRMGHTVTAITLHLSDTYVATSKCSNPTDTCVCALRSCTTCSEGRYGLGGKNVPCKYCPKGRYNDRTGITSEDDCKSYARMDNTIMDVGAAQCKLCDYGKVGLPQDTTKHYCNDCQAGQYMDQKGALPAKNVFQWKYSVSTSRFCTPCEAGRYSPDASTEDECKLCDAGKSTNNKVGQTSEAACIACPAGQYSDAKGSGSCKECPSGHFNNGEGNTDTCAKCPSSKPYTTLRDGRTTGASSMTCA